MKKTYKMFLALMMCMLGVVCVSAGERIPFDAEHFTFMSYSGWGVDAQPNGSIEGNFKINEADGCPIGDTSCNAWVDLSNYSKMYVSMKGCDADGNLNESYPRIFINRTEDNGQFNADESAAKCLVVPNAGTWAEDYYTVDKDGVYVIDLKAICKKWGFVHFHSIKGSAWNTKAIVYSIEVERQAKAPQGWTSIINNGDFESDDISSFVLAKEAKSGDGDATYPIEINDTVGRNGGRGLAVTSMADAYETWSTQLFVKLGEPLTEGMKWRFTMDVKAAAAANVTTGCHAAPRNWKAGGIIDAFDVTNEWQTITAEGTINADQGKAGIQSIAFDLNNDKVSANTFYFDNINFEVFKLGTTAEFSSIAILLDFGFDTNIPELVKNSGKKRLMYPNDCATVTVNGEAAEIYSVEAFEDGRFYIFLRESLDEDATVVVSLKNPKDAEHQIIYASGAVNGQVAGDVDELVASYNFDIIGDDGIPYDFSIPTLMVADPENGAFNLPNSISEFKLKFDKNVDCEKLTATLNGAALAVQPAEGYAEEIKLVRSGENLADGQYTLKIENIFAEMSISETFCGDTTLVLNIGKSEASEEVTELIPAEYFANCAANSIPEGFFVKFGSEDRPGGSVIASGGPRMFDFGAGGDFTKGLYFREGYVEYGTTVNKDPETGEIFNEYALELGAGKKYDISFNSAMWKDNGAQLCFRVYFKDDFDAAIAASEEPQAVLSQVVANKPNVNGSTAAVNGSAKTVIRFVPATTGKYVLRWVSTGLETGAAEYKEVILANPSVKYIPNTAGIEQITKLENALTDAKAVLNANSGDRYAGVDFDNLNNTITKVEADKDGYYNPSSFENAAEKLVAYAQALKDHRTLCDDYDASIKKAIDVERQNKTTKFNATELYAQVVNMNAKYNGISEWRNVADTIAEPGAEDWKLFYVFDELKTNDSLTVAVKELKDLANLTSLLFTQGVSATGDCGTKVLVDRLRRGAETLKALGVDENDELYLAAVNAVNDDDDIAEAIKNRIKLIIYKNPEQAFAAVMNEELGVEISPKYDMSVFFKNPNIYALQVKDGYGEVNTPGWNRPIGNGGISTMWVGGTPRNVPGVAEDVVFTTYHAATRFEQTIYDLPAGVYTVVLDAASWADEDVTDAFVFVKTSSDFDEDFTGKDAVEYYGQYQGHHDHEMENIEITDGQITVGANFPETSQWMFDQIKAVYMTTYSLEFNYEEAYNELVQTGIENAVAKTVRNVEIYDLNGRRVTSATRGINIVKKYMSDGTVRVQKMVKK